MLELKFVLPVATSVLLVLPAVALPMLPDVRSEIQSALRQTDDSLHRKDIAGCMRRFTTDFQGEDIKGNHYDRKQAKQNLIKSFSFAQSIKGRTTLRSATFIHDTAFVSVQEHTELTILGKRTHHLHTLVFDGLWRSVMVKTSTGWRTKREKQLTSTVATDGVVKAVTSAKS